MMETRLFNQEKNSFNLNLDPLLVRIQIQFKKICLIALLFQCIQPSFPAGTNLFCLFCFLPQLSITLCYTGYLVYDFTGNFCSGESAKMTLWKLHTVLQWLPGKSFEDDEIVFLPCSYGYIVQCTYLCQPYHESSKVYSILLMLF